MTYKSKEDFVAAKKEKTSMVIAALDVNEEAETMEALADMFGNRSNTSTINATLKEPIILTKRSMTVAVLSKSAVETAGGEVIVPLPPDETGFTPEISMSASALLSLSSTSANKNDEPLALAAAPVPASASRLMDEVLSTQRAGGDSNSNTPVLAAPPISISLFRTDGTRLEDVQLEVPLTFTLKDSAPDNVTCAYFDTQIKEWSTVGVRRVWPDSSSKALVCETRHLSIFGAIEGIFNDVLQTLVCSNIKAAFQWESWKNIVQDPSWAWETGGLTLWIALGLGLVSCIACLVWDIVEYRRMLAVKEDAENLTLQQRYMLMAKSRREKTSCDLDDLAKEAKKTSKTSCLPRPVLFAIRLTCRVLRAVWRTALKLAVKTLRLPNSVHSLILSLPDAPEQFTNMCVRRSHAARMGIKSESIESLTSQSQDDNAGSHAEHVQNSLELEKERFLHTSYLSRLLTMVLAVHPWMLILQFSDHVSHTARMVLAVAEVMGATAMGAIFFQTAGGALSRHRPPAEECKPRPGLLTEIVQAAVVAFVTCLLADFFIAFLAVVRFVDYEQIDELPPLERHDRLVMVSYRVKLFWVLTIGYIILCAGIMMAFLANVTEDDANKWLISSGMTLLEDFVIIPLFVGLLLATLATVFVCCSPRVQKIKHELRQKSMSRAGSLLSNAMDKVANAIPDVELDVETNAEGAMLPLEGATLPLEALEPSVDSHDISRDLHVTIKDSEDASADDWLHLPILRPAELPASSPERAVHVEDCEFEVGCFPLARCFEEALQSDQGVATVPV